MPRVLGQTWQQTPHVQPCGALLRRPASTAIALRTAKSFRELLGKMEGVLYEDHQVGARQHLG